MRKLYPAIAMCASLAAGAPPVRVLTPTARQYEKVEIALAPEHAPDNPFDPNGAELDAVIMTPSGKRMRVPGFWYQGYRRELQNPEAKGLERVEVLTPEGGPEWRVRFSGGETGTHRVVLEWKDQSGNHRSAEQTFLIVPGPRPGFIRVSPRNRQYLEDASGHVFFPLGENLCMYQRKEGTYYFDRLLDKLRAAGGNYVRLWQEYNLNSRMPVSGPGDGDFTGFPLETQVTGLAISLGLLARTISVLVTVTSGTQLPARWRRL